MTRKKAVLAAGLALLLVLAGCTGAEDGDQRPEDAGNVTGVVEVQSELPSDPGIYRVQDPKAQTVCYLRIDGDGDVAALDCVQLG